MSSSSVSSALLADADLTATTSDISAQAIGEVMNSDPSVRIDTVLDSISKNIVRQLFEREQFEQVVVVASDLLKGQKTSFLLKARGESFSKLNFHQKAIIDLKEALEIDPKCFKTHNNIALAYKETGFLNLASEHLVIAIKLQPDFAEAHNNRGNVMAEQAMMEGARMSYIRAIELDQDSASALWNLHSTCNDIDSAKAVLERCLEKDSGYEPAVYTLATINAFKGNTKFLDWILSTEIAKDSTLRSISWLLSLPKFPRLEFNRWGVFDFAIEKSDKSRALYEFGVWMGESFRYLEPHFKKSFGFDTFDGLPEDWHNIPSGTYSSFGKIPTIGKGEFIVGEFSKSLPEFFKKKRPMAGLLNFDADLYSSTSSALNHSISVMDEYSILVFDELIINENWEEDEYKALEEFCENSNSSYEVICASLFTKQVVLRLTNGRKSSSKS
jgi:Flp pilus assembly protein TadD